MIIYPYTAVKGENSLFKLSLELNLINPKIGGVLIRGEKGTAKSTTVRALAAMLPDMKFVNLPLNATEDRVVGGIDFNLAVKTGKRVFMPGLLYAAHKGILYVDEINLLDDHIVDIILDAAASGINRVDREGISYIHPASFILVGTMNPEEGDLRPQLLDRFGLCVDVKGCKNPDERVKIMALREEFDKNPARFDGKYAKKNKKAAKRIIDAKKRLKNVLIPEYIKKFIAALCVENNVAGHRADICMEQAAIAHAAFTGNGKVTADDINTVAGMVLIHRKRDAVPPEQPGQHDSHPPDDKREGEKGSSPENSGREEPGQNPDSGNDSGGWDENSFPRDKDIPAGSSKEDMKQSQFPETDPSYSFLKREHDRIFSIGATFKIKPFSSPRDKVFRRGSGRRSRTMASLKQGRYVKSSFNNKGGDIALDASLRAAAPYQISRENPEGLAVCIKPSDMRGKIREKRIGNFLVFLVDASGSMGARGRMAASKGAIMSLLLDAYQKRDKIAMISFRKTSAKINLPPTSSVEMAGKFLKKMPVGGRTPLSAGLVRAYDQVRNFLLKDPTARPIVIIITDGKANAALGDKKPIDEAFEIAGKIASQSFTKFIVVDTEEPGLISFGLAKRLAHILCAGYFSIDGLKAEDLVNVIKEEI